MHAKHPSPGASTCSLVLVNLVSGRYLLDRPVTTQRLKRDLGLKIRRKPALYRHFHIPPSNGGIHLKQLSDFLGPPQIETFHFNLQGLNLLGFPLS